MVNYGKLNYIFVILIQLIKIWLKILCRMMIHESGDGLILVRQHLGDEVSSALLLDIYKIVLKEKPNVKNACSA